MRTMQRWSWYRSWQILGDRPEVSFSTIWPYGTLIQTGGRRDGGRVSGTGERWYVSWWPAFLVFRSSLIRYCTRYRFLTVLLCVLQKFVVANTEWGNVCIFIVFLIRYTTADSPWRQLRGDRWPCNVQLRVPPPGKGNPTNINFPILQETSNKHENNL